jgi:hypothetical protein
MTVFDTIFDEISSFFPESSTTIEARKVLIAEQKLEKERKNKEIALIASKKIDERKEMEAQWPIYRKEIRDKAKRGDIQGFESLAHVYSYGLKGVPQHSGLGYAFAVTVDSSKKATPKQKESVEMVISSFRLNIAKNLYSRNIDSISLVDDVYGVKLSEKEQAFLSRSLCYVSALHINDTQFQCLDYYDNKSQMDGAIQLVSKDMKTLVSDFDKKFILFLKPLMNRAIAIED